MPTNPFKPPDTDSTKNPPPPVPAGSPLKAVLAGLAVDIGGTAVLGVVISVLWAIQLAAQGLSDSDLKEAMAHLPRDSALNVAGTLLGALLSVLGGYVCARIARRDEFRVGLVMAAISAGLGLVMMGAENEDGELLLLLTAATVACNLLGVKYGAERNRRGDAPAGPDEGASTP